ncbi:hypothetical protein HKD42_06635 [Altererythrobacter sp. RZ02]|uniref:Peptidoglycan binding-like domain-containing protein n=1 Tax=Pontixanthobacter rizhaonensis TaxID=2730337 RepID=A0A848QGJ9_9SPHN|nr:peptidoglycan-binding protein [Pontixanthobacter rizhaonensis]NMW31732.1 hypothetical protein [Pontixanthobacter rizhaonensis]
MGNIDREFFFNEVRKRPFGGSLLPTHVTGCNAIIDYWEEKYPDKSDRWLAYLLGTTYHETAHTMEAISEYGGAAYFNERYGPGTPVGRVLGNTQPGDGNRFHGRGFVQLTGRANYTDWKRRLGVDIVSHPERVLDQDIATRILMEGSIKGTFTGVKVGNYLTNSKNDWYHCRQVINRLDKAQHIANLGKQFWGAISYTDEGQVGQAKHRPILREGADGEDVRFLQRYLGVSTDGEFGPMTEHVVIAFQADKGLSADGVVGRNTWTKLLGKTAIRDTVIDSDVTEDTQIAVGDRPLVRFGSRSDYVKELQRLLELTDDGVFGPNTLDTVMQFQADNNLQADGIVGAITWTALLNQ